MATTMRGALRPIQKLRLRSTMAEAARLMYQGGVAALPVCLEDGPAILGVITERDVIATVAEGLDPIAVTVEERLQSPRSLGGSCPCPDIWFS